MRALVVTAIGIVCAGAVLLPLVPTENAGPRPEGRYEADAVPPVSSDAGGAVPGSTQSLALTGGGERKERGASTRTGDRLLSAWEDDPAGGSRANSRKVKPFSLVGVVWDDPSEMPPGRIQVQTRASGSGDWTPWRTLGTDGDEASGGPGAKISGGPADARSAPPGGHGEAALGATSPLWVGDSTAVRVRVVSPDGRTGTGGAGADEPKLPEGARLELVDPGKDSGPVKGRGGVLPALPDSAAGGASAGTADETNAGEEANASDKAGKAEKAGKPDQAGRAEKAEQSDQAGDTAKTETTEKAEKGSRAETGGGRKAGRSAPRPRIVTRKGWGADESLREPEIAYGSAPKAAFLHHSAESNGYSCAEAPAVVRGIYRFHVRSSHWRDIGYNFLVDKCGTVYEGRAGGVDKAVTGAHTLGFNDGTTGIALLGTYSRATPPAPALRALARLTAWKLGVHGVDARGKATLTSQGSSKHARGTKVTLDAVSGHRDGVTTDCPGAKLYAQLPAVRTEAGRLQGGR